MIGMLVALMLLSWIFGRTRGLIGGLAGGFVGALVVAGMTAATSNGELAALYSPDDSPGSLCRQRSSPLSSRWSRRTRSASPRRAGQSARFLPQ
jgi:hypothetical protein